MVDLANAPHKTSSPHVDLVLVRVRWLAWLLVFLVAWVGAGNLALPSTLWAWFIVVALTNLILGLLLRTKNFHRWLPTVSLGLDILLFGMLPYLVSSASTYFALFSVFPALVGAIRFGALAGFATAGLLTVSLGVHAFLPGDRPASADWATTAVIGAAMLMLNTLIGYLTQHEKDAAVHQAAGELVELRGAMAGAQLLYRSTDALNLTTSYKAVLEGMLDAGIAGLPETRREDGPPVGIALFFDEQDPAQKMRVAAARHLETRDAAQIISGKNGIVAETFKTGAAVVFDEVRNDPELSVFSALQRCRSGVCYPLQAGMEQYGVVVLASPAPRRPSAQQLDLMRAFTSQAGVAFQNAKLYHATRMEQDKIIHNEDEMRQKLARDLHDGPTQKIAALVMQLDYIQQLLDKNPGEVRKELEKAHTTAQQTVKEIRTALFTLRPLALETKGLSAALKQYGERLRDTEELAIQVEPGDFGSELDMNTAATVFAIIDEAVTNARKHARKAPIRVTLVKRDHALVATVRDEGQGFNVDKVVGSYENRASLGLQNMRDRAMLIGGELRIDSAPGSGTRVTLIVPLSAPSPEANL